MRREDESRSWAIWRHLFRRSALLVMLGLACPLAACTSQPPGDVDVPYGVTPATVFGPPDLSNVFFQAHGLSGGSSSPFRLTTDPASGHVATGCTGTTTFDGAEMIIDWSCMTATTASTVEGTLVWQDDHYQGDCVTSYTGPTFSFANVIVPFRAVK